MMSQLFWKFGWRVAGGLDTQQGLESLCLLAMPIVRYALLANDVIVTTWASYADYQLTNSLLRSTVSSLKSQARGQGKVMRGQTIGRGEVMARSGRGQTGSRQSGIGHASQVEVRRGQVGSG